MSQEDLVHAAQIDRTYISALERCRYAASIDVIERLSVVLDVSPGRLLDSLE
jgi:transcriptional regulator with XRE-family HTH domain